MEFTASSSIQYLTVIENNNTVSDNFGGGCRLQECDGRMNDA